MRCWAGGALLRGHARRTETHNRLARAQHHRHPWKVARVAEVAACSFSWNDYARRPAGATRRLTAPAGRDRGDAELLITHALPLPTCARKEGHPTSRDARPAAEHHGSFLDIVAARVIRSSIPGQVYGFEIWVTVDGWEASNKPESRRSRAVCSARYTLRGPCDSCDFSSRCARSRNTHGLRLLRLLRLSVAGVARGSTVATSTAIMPWRCVGQSPRPVPSRVTIV